MDNQHKASIENCSLSKSSFFSKTFDETFSRPSREHTPLLNSSNLQWEHKHIQINVFIQISTNQAFSTTNVQRALKQWEATAFELNHFCHHSISTPKKIKQGIPVGRCCLGEKLWEMNDYFNVATSLSVP